MFLISYISIIIKALSQGYWSFLFHWVCWIALMSSEVLWSVLLYLASWKTEALSKEPVKVRKQLCVNPPFLGNLSCCSPGHDRFPWVGGLQSDKTGRWKDKLDLLWTLPFKTLSLISDLRYGFVSIVMSSLLNLWRPLDRSLNGMFSVKNNTIGIFQYILKRRGRLSSTNNQRNALFAVWRPLQCYPATSVLCIV